MHCWYWTKRHDYMSGQFLTKTDQTPTENKFDASSIQQIIHNWLHNDNYCQILISGSEISHDQPSQQLLDTVETRALYSGFQINKSHNQSVTLLYLGCAAWERCGGIRWPWFNRYTAPTCYRDTPYMNRLGSSSWRQSASLKCFTCWWSSLRADWIRAQ